jgi:hypothetical protein
VLPASPMLQVLHLNIEFDIQSSIPGDDFFFGLAVDTG